MNSDVAFGPESTVAFFSSIFVSYWNWFSIFKQEEIIWEFPKLVATLDVPEF